MVILENNFLKVSVSPTGAQLVSLVNKLNRNELMWQADPAVWGFHAPNLFPVVGGCLNNEIHVDGKPYPMSRHGFARTSEFEVEEQTSTHAKFSLAWSEKTLESYPFRFVFQVLFDLFDSELRVSYKVINQDEGSIYFSVGAHPAFNIPFFGNEKYHDYYLEFQEDENLTCALYNAEGFFTGETSELKKDGKVLPLSKDLFADGALVFKSLKSREVMIKNTKTPNFISVAFPHFESLGIWAAPGADFVCIEPWLGYGDQAGSPVELSEKAGIRKLEHGHVFEVDYTVGVN